METQFGESKDSALSFARRYSLYPGNSAAGYSALNELQRRETLLKGHFKGFRHTRLFASSAGRASVTMQSTATARGKAVQVTPKLLTHSGSGGLPCYFLPWDGRGAAVELTIPNRDPNLPERDHPRFFFTAALSGCSVFISGAANNPTVYHCGIGETGTTPFNESHIFWRHLVTLSQRNRLSKGRGGLAEVGSDSYMNQKLPRGRLRPAMTLNAVQALEERYGDSVLAEQLARWGAVFGIREAGSRDWEFYLQRNLAVTPIVWEDVQETITERRKVLGIFRRSVRVTRTSKGFVKKTAESVPELVTRIFPGTGRTPPLVSKTRLRV